MMELYQFVLGSCSFIDIPDPLTPEDLYLQPTKVVEFEFEPGVRNVLVEIKQNI